MKKIVSSLIVFFLIYFLASVAEAKPYKPLSISGDYTVDIPDEAFIPDLSGFEMAKTKYDRAADSFGSDLTINYYRNPAYIYLLADNEEIFPYIEILKWEKNAVHLVFIAFINKRDEMEIYVDKDALTKPASGRLEKFFPQEKEEIRKIPRR